jgi:deazaflavin-dependent oxidoreductase (nitroreductase family)
MSTQQMQALPAPVPRAPSTTPPSGSPAPGRNRLTLGHKSRAAIRFIAGLINPAVLWIAGRRWMPVLGIVRHRGFRTGRAYATPVGVRPLDDTFLLPLTFGESSAWYRNIDAAGWCVIKYGGVDRLVVDPEIVTGASALPAYPRYERLMLRLIGVDQYLRLRTAPSGWVVAAAPAAPHHR